MTRRQPEHPTNVDFERAIEYLTRTKDGFLSEKDALVAAALIGRIGDWFSAGLPGYAVESWLSGHKEIPHETL